MRAFAQFFLLAGLISLVPLTAAGVAIEQGGAVAAAPAAPVTAQGPRLPNVSVQFHLLSQKPQAGKPMEFEALFQAPPAVSWEGPVFGREFGPWVVLKHQPGPSEMQRGYQVRTDRLQLLTYASGKVELPVMGFKIRLPDGRSGQVPSQALSVMVLPLANPGAGWQVFLRNLKRPIGFFPWWQALLVLALAAAILAGLWQYAQRKGLIRSNPAEPVRPPEVIARERLAALRASSLLAEGRYKAYYSELTEIMRRYLEGRFTIAALDQTTAELMRGLKAKQFPRQDIAMLRAMLERGDLVKFAKARPDEPEALSDWQAVADWVERTAPVQAPEPETPPSPTQAEKAKPESEKTA